MGFTTNGSNRAGNLSVAVLRREVFAMHLFDLLLSI